MWNITAVGETSLSAGISSFDPSEYIMSITCFCETIQCILCMYINEEEKEEDVWWQLVDTFQACNDN